MSKNNNWYVITGGPSTGKTTLLAELEKGGYKTVPEAARTLIDQAVAKGITVDKLRQDEKRFQEDVIRLKQKIEMQHQPDALTFFDRGAHDTIAYMKYYGFNLERWVDKIVRGSTYQKVFLLDPLPAFEQDYARTENQDFTRDIHKLLHDAYSEFGMLPIHVKATSVKKRAKIILDQIEAR